MRTIVLGAAITAAAVIGVDVLGDMTQTRPDAADHEGATRIELEITAKPGAGRLDFVVDGLWGACQHTVQRPLQGEWERRGADHFVGNVYPALGKHARTRLTGCLHDVTIDRAKAHIVSMQRVPVCVSERREPGCVEVRRAGG